MSVFRLVVLCSLVVFCLSCATEMHGVYRVLHRERIAADYEVYLLRHEDSVRFYVEFKGDPVCEMEIDPEETRSVVSPYRFAHGETDNITTLYDGEKIVTVRWITKGMHTVVLYDLDGNGFPEMRVTTGEDGRLIEKLEPVVKSSELKQ